MKTFGIVIAAIVIPGGFIVLALGYVSQWYARENEPAAAMA